MPSPPVFTLNVHHDYACRHSGACCTAGWDIGVDRATYEGIAAAIESDALALPSRPGDNEAPSVFVRGTGHPPGDVAFIARTAAGDCACFDRHAGNLCVIQRSLGHEALPTACRHFPRVALLDAAGVHVTLSHYCPTAAAMLFRDDIGALEVVENPPAFAERDYEGFDARETVPPFLRRGVFFDSAARAIWDRFVIDALNRETWLPGQALACVESAAAALQRWVPEAGSLESVARQVTRHALASEPRVPGRKSRRVAGLFEVVTSTVPAGLDVPVLPATSVETFESAVPADWAGLARPVRRYLAARAFGAWSAYQAEGLLTEVAMQAVALAVLEVEASRAAIAARRPLDAGLLMEAIRAADKLLVHLASGDRLVHALGRQTPSGAQP